MSNVVESNWNIWKRRNVKKRWAFVCAVPTHTQAAEACETLQASGYETKADLVTRNIKNVDND